MGLPEMVGHLGQWWPVNRKNNSTAIVLSELETWWVSMQGIVGRDVFSEMVNQKVSLGSGEIALL